MEKQWEKQRNRYSRVKRELREKDVSSTGTVSLKNAKRNIDQLNFLSSMEPSIKLRQSRGTYTSIKKREKEERVFEDILEPGEIRGLLEENDDSNKVLGSDSKSVSGAKSTNKTVTIDIKRKVNYNSVKNVMSKQEQKEVETLESVGQGVKAFTLSKNLAEVLPEEEMEDLQEYIMDVLRKTKKNAKKRKNTNNKPFSRCGRHVCLCFSAMHCWLARVKKFAAY